MIRSGDIDACRALLAKGSKSFDLASRALPSRLRDPVAAFYAFCRTSDDAVDEGDDPHRALVVLRERVESAFAGRPIDDPIDRALAWLATTHGLPRAPVDALIEGYAWDVEGRRYEDPSALLAYAARVAGSVGVAMTALMGSRDPWVLARAADLGVAMQLTNVARDVGADARLGRLYLPRTWLADEGVDADAWLARPRFELGVGRVVQRVLAEAEPIYARAEQGVPYLPSDCRAAIAGAASIYREIGRVVASRGYDSVTSRASTTFARKALLLAKAIGSRHHATRPRCDDGPLAEAAFLIGA